jgi:hypothetical protein
MGWKDWSYKKKGFYVGLIIGLFFAIIAFVGIAICSWNPVASDSVPVGICSSEIILFYFPYVPFHIAAIILYSPFRVEWVYSILNFLFLIGYIFAFSGIGSFIGWIIGKIKSKK